MKMHNPYIDYYLNQQGHGADVAVFRGAPWQMGHGQMGYGLGALFRSLAKVAMPILKRGAKSLGKIALSMGKDLLGDAMEGKNVKEAAKARGKEALGGAKNKALDFVQQKVEKSQTGQGHRKRSRSIKRSRSSRSRSSKRQKGSRKVKKRKASRSVSRRRQTKRQKTTPADIFG